MWDYSNIVEVTIDRPAKDVWPYFFGRKNAAWTKTDYTPIAGQSGTVGEIYAMAYPIANQPGQLCFEAIRVKPEKQLVLKITYQKNAESERKLSGYDFITLSEVAGRTTVVLQQATELVVDPTTDLNLLTEKHDKFIADIFQNLKRMVEVSPVIG